MKLDEDSWAEVRAAWETTTEPGRRIAARFGVAHPTLYANALRRGWAPRPSTAVRVIPQPLVKPYPLLPASMVIANVAASAPAGALETTEPIVVQVTSPAGPTANDTLDGLTPLEPREPDTPVARAVRMLRLIDLQLDSMERTMASGEPMSSQDGERNARTTTALTNLAETVTQTIANKDMVANDGRVQATDVCAEADRLRHEIAARIERLNEKWLAEQTAE